MPARRFPDRFLVAFSLAGEQRELVRAIAGAVEKQLGEGSVFLDEWFEHYIAGADADLTLQSIYGKRSALAVVCVSERYGGKPWTLMEHEAIRARAMQSRTSADPRDRKSVLPIRVGDGDVEGIPFNAIVPDVREKTPDQAAELIINRLRLVVSEMPIGWGDQGLAPAWPESLPALVWPMADHSGAREAFAVLLTRGSPWRFLPVRGPSEVGKSHITKQMLANALQMPDIACGRFDFKGGIDMDAEMRVFVQELNVPLPPHSPLLNERFTQILEGLMTRRHPALLIFDTYEQARREQQDWVEKELLIRLVRAPWLRVVVAGQRVPEGVGAIWASVAHPILELRPPRPAEWYDYARQHRPELKLEDVETVCRVAGDDKATVLSQMFGPRT